MLTRKKPFIRSQVSGTQVKMITCIFSQITINHTCHTTYPRKNEQIHFKQIQPIQHYFLLKMSKYSLHIININLRISPYMGITYKILGEILQL